MIAIIDYGAGNLQSVKKAFDYLGVETAVTADPRVLSSAAAAVLPGVGAFGDAMAALRSLQLEEPIRHFIEQDKPFLGICLGLQLLFEGSEESPGVPGLGVLKGTIHRIPDGPGLKIPHIGWNSLRLLQKDGLFAGLEEEPYVYFVHSYFPAGGGPLRCLCAKTEYGVAIDAAVRRGSLNAVQFHPEKSGKTGLAMLKNFAGLL